LAEWSKQTRRRFYAKVVSEGECLIWTGAIDINGYGSCLKKSYGSWKPHRAVYLQKYGSTPLVIDHLCGNRKCVKLSHLEAVTQAQNVFRSSTTKRTLEHCANGHKITPKNTKIDGGYYRCRECASATSLRSYYKNKALANTDKNI
jgi:hypothetical protein